MAMLQILRGAKGSGLDKSFAGQYLERVCSDTSLQERAKKGVLPSTIFLHELVNLMTDDQAQHIALSNELMFVCLRGELKASVTDVDEHGRKNPKGPLARHTGDDSARVFFLIHRDDARRYFSSLGLEPETASPLWCWIRGKLAADAGKLSASQQDKADFQALCLGVWLRNPTMTITGESGVTQQPETIRYQRNYALKTLEGWARAVAPDIVKNRRGAPKKYTPV
jgi:hypothetical protein